MGVLPLIAMSRGDGSMWQPPLELAGVKSRKRPVFEIACGGLESNSAGINRICGLKLTLESRVCALAPAGRVGVEVLLGQRQLKSGTVLRHESLNVVHLGPHLAFDSHCVEEHLAACAAVLATRPQVVVLEASSSRAEDAWSFAFDELLREALHNFRGAVVVLGDECPKLFSQLSGGQCWSGAAGWLWQQPVPPGPQLLEDVFASEAQTEPDLMHEIQTLGESAFFGENIVDKALDRGWTLAALVDSIATQQCQGEVPAQTIRLCGFMCYRIRKNEFHIARLAVVPEDRARGHGKRMMQWALEKAATLPRSECAWISLSSLDEAVPFYERFGFTDMTCDDLDDDEHFQTWMELKNISVVPEDSDED